MHAYHYNEVNDTVYWIVFGILSSIALANNIHGYFILRTTESTFNSKFYFIIRVFLQLGIFYTGISLMMKRNFKWQPINPDPTDALIEKVSFYVTIILVFSLIVGIFVSYSAVKLIGEKKHRESLIDSASSSGVNRDRASTA